MRAWRKAWPTILALLAGAAWAPPPGRELPPFGQADTDNDGFLSLEEARRVGIPPERFRREDLDHDGRIDIVQYKYGIQRDVTDGEPGDSEANGPMP
jgi:hypothetical protein